MGKVAGFLMAAILALSCICIIALALSVIREFFIDPILLDFIIASVLVAGVVALIDARIKSKE